MGEHTDEVLPGGHAVLQGLLQLQGLQSRDQIGRTCMLRTLVVEEEYVDCAGLFQPGGHHGAGRHKPTDVEPLDLERCPDRVEQCLDDMAESACTRYLAVLSPPCQNAVEIYRTNMASVHR